MDLHGVRIACVTSDGVEESELTEPVRAFRDAGARVSVLAAGESKGKREVRTFRHLDPASRVPIDGSIADATADGFDALLIPGGRAPDMIRTDEAVLDFVREMDRTQKPLLVICHGPQVLISAAVVAGRTLTSWPSVAIDIKNAGGHWIDQEVVRDGNLVTSRKPGDLPAFIADGMRLLAASRHAETAGAALQRSSG